MYALINGQELVLGPMAFNYRMINSVLEEELEVSFRVTPQDYQNVPIMVKSKYCSTYIKKNTKAECK